MLEPRMEAGAMRDPKDSSWHYAFYYPSKNPTEYYLFAFQLLPERARFQSGTEWRVKWVAKRPFKRYRYRTRGEMSLEVEGLLPITDISHLDRMVRASSIVSYGTGGVDIGAVLRFRYFDPETVPGFVSKEGAIVTFSTLSNYPTVPDDEENSYLRGILGVDARFWFVCSKRTTLEPLNRWVSIDGTNTRLGKYTLRGEMIYYGQDGQLI